MCTQQTTATQNQTALAGQASSTTECVSIQEAAAAAKKLRGFINPWQLSLVGDLCRGEEGKFYRNKLFELGATVDSMPATYQTDGQGDQAIVHLHYFLNGCDWYITERDMEPEQLQAFGLADLGYGRELGYISIVELMECGAELDLHWQPRKLNEI